MAKKCNYYREAGNMGYVPSCGVEEGFAFIWMYPDEIEDFKFCPFCGGKIKRKENTQHPELNHEY